MIQVGSTIKKQPISTMIDFENTYNYLDPGIVKQTRVSIQQTNSLTILVVDGSRIATAVICKQLEWFIQGTLFQVDFRMLFSGGYNIVLGADYTMTITWDFKNLRMEFKHNNRKDV